MWESRHARTMCVRVLPELSRAILREHRAETFINVARESFANYAFAFGGMLLKHRITTGAAVPLNLCSIPFHLTTRVSQLLTWYVSYCRKVRGAPRGCVSRRAPCA